MAQSQSGTGKITTLALAILSRIDSSIQSPQALIIVPIFELAVQIGSVIEKMSQFLPDIKIAYAVRDPLLSNRTNLVRNKLLSEPIVSVHLVQSMIGVYENMLLIYVIYG